VICGGSSHALFGQRAIGWVRSFFARCHLGRVGLIDGVLELTLDAAGQPAVSTQTSPADEVLHPLPP
jgi:hypothetical protein